MSRNLALTLALLTLVFRAHAQNTPPWSKGANDPAPDRGFVFHVPDVDNVPDLHGNPTDAELVLFIGGNQFFVLPQLIAGFSKLHPEVAGKIFYETLPPGVLRKQIASGNTVTLGNLTLAVTPDVFEAGQNVLAQMKADGTLDSVTAYATNDLEIMVAAGNPKKITGLKDLAREDVRVSLPNQQFEGVARQVLVSLTKAGGDALATDVYQTRVQNGGVFLTQIHHRQTPMRIMQQSSDAGVVWSSEVRFQQSIGNPIAGVSIPAEQNTTAIYAAGTLTHAPHRAAAEAWIAYLQSEPAQAVYRSFGFKSLAPPAKP